jgi:hypothetical protein
MNSVCDRVYVFDQDSNDGSREKYKLNSKFRVINSDTNRFYEELVCKNELLGLIGSEGGCDWIFWLDGDTLLDGRLVDDRKGLIEICEKADKTGCSGISFGHMNLWRSDTYYRLDNKFNWLNEKGVCCLWKYSKGLKFPLESGLHKQSVPSGINKICRSNFFLIHRGFSTDQQILKRYQERYRMYLKNKKTGRILNRLFDESTLTVKKIDKELYPKWFDISDDLNPKEKEKLINLYREIPESFLGTTWEEGIRLYQKEWKL